MPSPQGLLHKAALWLYGLIITYTSVRFVWSTTVSLKLDSLEQENILGVVTSYQVGRKPRYY